MPDLPKQVLRADFVKIMDFWAGEGSNLDEIVAEQIGLRYRFFLPSKTRGFRLDAYQVGAEMLKLRHWVVVGRSANPIVR